MGVQGPDLDRELFVSLYATKLKELRGTPYAHRDIRELERTAERYLEAVEKALAGDRGPLQRYLQHTILTRGRESCRSWQILQSFDAFRDVAKLAPAVLGDFLRVDDLLHWVAVRFSQLYEELQTERGLLPMVESLTLALEAKEKYTSSHSQSVQKIAEKISRVLGVDVGLAGLFHDIGKIHVPDSILTKRQPLTPEEWNQMRQHPYHSFRILSPIAPEAASICLRHHERPDGRGYPLGEARVPLEANVISAADTLHSICSSRSYRGSQRLDSALQEIRTHGGTQFLPEVVVAVEKTYGDMAGLLAAFGPETTEA